VMPTTLLLLVPGCKWVGAVLPPPLCTGTGMLWGDVLLLIFIIYLSYLLSFASNQLDDVSIKWCIYFWNSKSGRRRVQRIQKFLYDKSEVFVFYLYFNIQNMEKIYHVSTITALCYMSIFFTLSVHCTQPDSLVNNNYSQLV
jgi:hypothetical protein